MTSNVLTITHDFQGCSLQLSSMESSWTAQWLAVLPHRYPPLAMPAPRSAFPLMRNFQHHHRRRCACRETSQNRFDHPLHLLHAALIPLSSRLFCDSPVLPRGPGNPKCGFQHIFLTDGEGVGIDNLIPQIIKTDPLALNR